MWERARGAVAASSIVIKTVMKLVVQSPGWVSTLCLPALLLEGVLLWVPLVGQGVDSIQSGGPQLLVNHIPGFFRVPLQLCPELLVIRIHLVERELIG